MYGFLLLKNYAKFCVCLSHEIEITHSGCGYNKQHLRTPLQGPSSELRFILTL